MSDSVIFEGIDWAQVRSAVIRGVDAAGNAIEPFVDDEGGWPLRCCLGESVPGDRIAIIAWSPYPWTGAYAETGPVVVHSDGCPGTSRSATLPRQLDERPMVLRPYGPEHTILYDRVRFVDAGGGVEAHTHALLADPAVDEVYASNATGGCFAFRAVRGS